MADPDQPAPPPTQPPPTQPPVAQAAARPAFAPAAAAPAPSPARPSAAAGEARETLRFLLKLALVVLLVRSFLFAPYSIPSESMLPRLLIGDYLFVTKFNYGYSRWSLPWGWPLVPHVQWRLPARGDVVVFRSPPAPDEHDVIKRVIGLPGDVVQMRRGQLVLNGVPVPKRRLADFAVPVSPNFTCPAQFQAAAAGGAGAECRFPRFLETLPGGRQYQVLDLGYSPRADDTDTYTVPAGHVFLMGDNRDNSADSRFAPPEGMGYVPVERIEGRALVTFFSTDGSASWVKPWTWFSAARPRRIGEGF